MRKDLILFYVIMGFVVVVGFVILIALLNGGSEGVTYGKINVEIVPTDEAVTIDEPEEETEEEVEEVIEIIDEEEEEIEEEEPEEIDEEIEEEPEETEGSETIYEEDLGHNQIEYDELTWPVTDVFTDYQNALSSPFGPRLMASDDYRYDFHRGIDIPGDTGDEVVTVADGEIFRVYEEGSDSYPAGGNVVIIKHEFDDDFEFHGDYIARYYSLYMHLDSFSEDIQKYMQDGFPDKINQGDVIGYIGDSGTTDYEHLHFEIRVGTTCSWDYQQSNDCSIEGFDPHVNPLMLLPYDQDDDFEIEVEKDGDDIIIEITSPREELDINRIGVEFDNEEIVLDFNTREGIDLEDIDDNSYNDITIEPEKFNKNTDEYEITVIFENIDSETYTAYVEDIWGNRKAISVISEP